MPLICWNAWICLGVKELLEMSKTIDILWLHATSKISFSTRQLPIIPALKEAEVGTLKVHGQPRIYRETLSKNLIYRFYIITTRRKSFTFIWGQCACVIYASECAVHMWQPEQGVICLSLQCLHYCFETGSCIHLKVYHHGTAVWSGSSLNPPVSSYKRWYHSYI